jgi:glutathione-regulated potassium-efflux system protein KefB
MEARTQGEQGADAVVEGRGTGALLYFYPALKMVSWGAMDLDAHFLFSLVWLLVVATVAVGLFSRAGLGSILGLLVTGVVVGPYSPGPVLTDNVEAMRHFTELGVVLLLFLIGTEMRPRHLWSMRRQVFGLGALQVIITGFLIAAYVLFHALSWRTALITGLTLALSSTALVMQILHERGETASPHGSAGFAVLLMQDLAVVPLLALVPILSNKGTLSAGIPLWEQLGIVTGMIALVLVFGRYVVPKVLDRLTRDQNREGFLLVILLAVFVSAWAMTRAGLSMALGAFLMGMLVADSRYRYQIQALIEPFKGLLMSLFFVAVGMSIDLQAVTEHPGRLAADVFVIVLLKILVLTVLGLLFSLRPGTAVRVGFLLGQAGEFGFVLLGTAKALGVVSDGNFVLGAALISVSMMLTPLLVSVGNRLADRLESSQKDPEAEASPVTAPGQVVIAGYGRVGHSVAVLLHQSGVPVRIFEKAPERVAQGRKDGFPVYFGDIADPHLLAASRVDQAALVILAVDHPRTALRALTHLRNVCPNLRVIARAKDLEGVGQLLSAGATLAYPEILEGSLRLGAEALRILGVSGDKVDRLMEGVRSTRYEVLR